MAGRHDLTRIVLQFVQGAEIVAVSISEVKATDFVEVKFSLLVLPKCDENVDFNASFVQRIVERWSDLRSQVRGVQSEPSTDFTSLPSVCKTEIRS